MEYSLSPPIFRLNADIILELFKYLQPDVRHVLALRQTCREINGWTRMRQYWHSTLLQVAKHIPVPFYDRIRVPTMDGAQMEELVVRLIRLDLNWNHRTPTPLSIQTIPFPASHSSQRFTALKHVTGGRFLLCGSEVNGSQIFCLDFEDPESRICTLGSWSSEEVPWTSPSLLEFHGRYRDPNNSEITVTAFFSVQGTGNDVQTHSSLGIWQFDSQAWPPVPIQLPSLNFAASLEYFDVSSKLVACGTTGRVSVIDYRPTSETRLRQGVFYPQLPDGRQIRELRLLPTQILVLMKQSITLYPHPQLHSTDDIEDFVACQSAVDALWSWPLDEERIGPFRLFSCPEYDIIGPTNDPLSNTYQLFFYLTARHLFTIFPRDSPSTPIKFTRLAAKGINLSQSLQGSTRALLGPNGKRGVWLHTSPGSLHLAIQLVDFWGHGYCPQLWAESFQTYSDTKEVVMKENHGYIAGQIPMPWTFAFDESLGRLVLAIADTLVVYRF